MKRRQFLTSIAATSVSAAAIASLPTRAVPQTNSSRTARGTRFQINVPQAKLNQIATRVQAYQWHQAPTDAGWNYGVDQNYMKELVAYWLNQYDWRKHEQEMNRFNHYTAQVDKQTVHFVYEPGSGKNSQPLLLLHGWPYSFYSFLNLVEPLAHPERFGGNAEDGFDVIIPSLPGFAFSEAPRELQGLRFAANRLHRLMTQTLGYDRFIVQGGDFGDVAGVWMALDHPESIIGLHENQLAFRDAGTAFNSGRIVGSSTAEERAYMKREQENFPNQFAYFQLQSTRSETLSMAVMDSPVGQASWIVEKFYYWTDKSRKSFEQIYSMDHLLTEVMVYLVTDSFHTSIRPYTAFRALKDETPIIPQGRKITIPVGLAAFPNDALAPIPPRSLLERSRSNIVQWTQMPNGGHFPFYEEPKRFIDDIIAFGRKLR